MKFKVWKKNNLIGKWDISIKIDGVRCHNTTEGKISRKGKPLYNIPEFKGEIAEIYCGTFEKTINKTASSKKANTVLPDEIYILQPEVDKRLRLKTLENPTVEQINKIFQAVRNHGYEGLVLKNGDKYLKVKPEETIDVPITGFYEGKGRNVGRLGGFITTQGRVGSGLTDVQRQEYWDNKEALMGETVEVSCMQFTKTGKFRHPRFVRLRPDK